MVDSINHIDKLGQGMRNHVGRKRPWRNYSVPRPNALWHIDGHHKLITWGIVLHGIADGYTHKVSVYNIYDTNLRLSRSLDSVQAQITDLKLFWTCLLMQSWNMVFSPECEAIEEAKIGTYLFLLFYCVGSIVPVLCGGLQYLIPELNVFG